MNDPQDISKTFMECNTTYEMLLNGGLPLKLAIQQMRLTRQQGEHLELSCMERRRHRRPALEGKNCIFESCCYGHSCRDHHS